MGYTHGFTNDDEFRVCTKCNKKLPNTTEYFGYANKKIGRLNAVCKECTKEINKEKRLKIIESNKDKDLFYDSKRHCKKYGRDFQNNK